MMMMMMMMMIMLSCYNKVETPGTY